MTRPDALVAERYRLVRPIGGGGMGTVWEAWDERLHRRVALKVLHPQRGRDAAEAKLARDRAMREARITARLHHAHAVEVYDVAEIDGEPCLIMQYLPSRSLQTILSERGTLPVGQVARIGSQVASALAAAHRVGIVHRDVKPGNILIDAEGEVKITDFGISHAVGDVSLTSTGMVTGTPAFLSPEVARGAESNAASDVFSLGATLYTALEGDPPFGGGENPMATLHRVASGQMLPPRRSGAMTPILMRMLSTRPADRPTMDDVTRVLSGAATHDTIEMPLRTVDAPLQTVEAPPASPVEPDRRGHGRPVLIGVVIALLLGGTGVALAAALTGTTPGQGHGPVAADTPGVSHSPHHRTTGPAPTSTVHSPPPTPSTPSTHSAAPTSAAAVGAPTAQELTGAIQDYYALLPGNTAAGWPRMTSRYRREHAGGRSGYDQFWGEMRSVSVSEISASPPHSVTATVTYTYRNGHVVTERTAFGLVRRGGMLKIDRTTVLSSTGG